MWLKPRSYGVTTLAWSQHAACCDTADSSSQVASGSELELRICSLMKLKLMLGEKLKGPTLNPDATPSVRKNHLPNSGTVDAKSTDTVTSNLHAVWYEAQPRKALVEEIPSRDTQQTIRETATTSRTDLLNDSHVNTNIAMFSRMTYDKIINSIISPVINSVCKNERENNLKELQKSSNVWLAGDGQYDSPEFCAKYVIYSLMVLHRGIIVECIEEEKSKKLWLNSCSEAYYALKKIVLDKSFLKDLKHVKHYVHTSNLESYPNVRLKYAPKRVHFSFSSLHQRSILAVLDFGMSQYSKSSGDWVLKNKYALSSDGWKEAIMKLILAYLRDQDLPEEEPGKAIDLLLPKNIAPVPRPSIDALKKKHFSRF
ncbi:hypothetical protein PR048_015946 [Dryococelus australis]|uniref:Uncharacterized protein n=1 Tax=Dryococelus australis TaxID=614101 RepID=A0ABQ9HIE7_9NEOP|nr:hypothetical protein PR048_015946 [Dryococelus australis]